MRNKLKVLCLMVLVVLVTGCLRTRSDIKASEERKKFESNVMRLQADRGVQFQELQDQLAQYQGRIEVLESDVNRMKLAEEERAKSFELEKALQEDKQKALIEAIQKLENEVTSLKSSRSKKKKAKTQKKGGPFTRATAEFKSKNWKQAIDLYDRYRSKWPKGSRYPEATYKMGVSFQELKMYDEAELFYSEVIQKFPKDKHAKKSKYRLSKIKKRRKK